MPNAADMKWFKENFHAEVETAIANTPFTLDLIVALACQETGDVWPILRKKPLTVDQILALCVGDTIDFNPANGKGRKAFPRNKAALLAVPRGDEMFAIARQALLDVAQQIPGFPVSNSNKFCHGYGMFQLDLQFFKEDPDYFLEKDRQGQEDRFVRQAVAYRHGIDGGSDRLQHRQLQAEFGPEAGPFRWQQVLRRRDFRFHPRRPHGAGAGRNAHITPAAARPGHRAASDAGGGDRAVLRGAHADQPVAGAQRAQDQLTADCQRGRAIAGRSPGARRHRHQGKELPRN